MAAQTGIAGSTVIGKNCMFGGQVGVAGHLTIANEVKLAAQTGVGGNIKKQGDIMQGSPAFNIRNYQKSSVYFRKLPLINDRISQLEKELKELKKDL